MTDDFYEEPVTGSTVGPPPPLPGRHDASLLFLAGPSAGQYHKIPRAGLTVGRDETADVRIPDPGVSRRHAQITWTARGHIEIKDLDSRHGVYVEGQPVSRRALEDGDRVQLSSDTVLRVRYQDAQETEILDRVQEAISRDPLTHVANRRAFTERLEQELAFARRHRTSLTVMLIDVDRFKSINDTHGHSAGDDALRSISRTLREGLRLEDVIARYGGDEFVILLRGYSDRDAETLASRLAKAVRDHPLRRGNVDVPLTLSVGIAMFGDGEPSAMMDLIARADAALYAAKRRGRDRVVLWSSLSDGHSTL